MLLAATSLFQPIGRSTRERRAIAQVLDRAMIPQRFFVVNQTVRQSGRRFSEPANGTRNATIIMIAIAKTSSPCRKTLRFTG